MSQSGYLATPPGGGRRPARYQNAQQPRLEARNNFADQDVATGFLQPEEQIDWGDYGTKALEMSAQQPAQRPIQQQPQQYQEQIAPFDIVALGPIMQDAVYDVQMAFIYLNNQMFRLLMGLAIAPDNSFIAMESWVYEVPQMNSDNYEWVDGFSNVILSLYDNMYELGTSKARIEWLPQE